jgi:hypothetical protein
MILVSMETVGQPWPPSRQAAREATAERDESFERRVPPAAACGEWAQSGRFV